MKTYVEQLEERVANLRKEGLLRWHVSFDPNASDEEVAKDCLRLFDAAARGNLCSPIPEDL